MKDKLKASAAVKNKRRNVEIFERNSVREVLIAVCDHGEQAGPREVLNE